MIPSPNQDTLGFDIDIRSWEADVAQPDSMTWTIDGNDAVIMLFLTTGELTPEAWGAAVAEQLGEDNCEVSSTKHTLAGKPFQGRKLVATVGGATMVMVGLDLGAYQGKQRLLVLQDTLTDEGGSSDEFQDVLSTLQKTFRLN